MLELKDVRFSVEDDNGSKKDIINGISLTIDESKFVAITGPKRQWKIHIGKINCRNNKANIRKNII